MVYNNNQIYFSTKITVLPLLVVPVNSFIINLPFPLNEIKASKQIKQNDIITIRGKGRFFIKEIIGQTRSGRTILKVEKFV